MLAYRQDIRTISNPMGILLTTGAVILTAALKTRKWMHIFSCRFFAGLHNVNYFTLQRKIYHCDVICGVILRAAGSRLVAVKMTAGRPSRYMLLYH
jgi:hypothetical protein